MHRIRIADPRTQAAAQFSAAPDECLLYAGLRAGLELPYGCASGTCGQCVAKLVHGNPRRLWNEAPGWAAAGARADQILLCQCAPAGDLEIRASMATAPAGATPRPAPRPLEATIAQLRRLTRDVLELELQLGEDFAFQPGQFVMLRFAGIEGPRAYSMSNFSPRTRSLGFLIRSKPDGRASRYLFHAAAPGDRVGLFGPLGKASYDAPEMRDLVLIAGGTGIAGLLSILRAIRQHGDVQRKVELFFGVRTGADLFHAETLAEFVREAPAQRRVVVALSDESPVPQELRLRHAALEFDTGLISDVAARHLRKDLEQPTAFLAGAPAAVDAVIRMLMRHSPIPFDRMKFDKFG